MAGAMLTFALWRPSNPDDVRRLTAVIVGIVFVFLFGLWDDRHELAAWPQFVAQAVAALIAIAGTVYIERFTNPLTDQLVIIPDIVPFLGWGIVVGVTIFWVMGMMNTVNWLDGLDGLATGVGLIAATSHDVRHSLVPVGTIGNRSVPHGTSRRVPGVPSL
jgi:UDP-GlcNAc:undecaprenyl-phosphate GlcNAc-1-phosphate transferase